MNTLVIMMGVPGSGKSTFVKNHIQDNDLYISRDEIRYSLISNEDEYFSKEDIVLKTFIDKINEGIKANKYNYIFADATHLNINSRRKLLGNLTEKPNDIVAIFPNINIETAIARNNLRQGRAKVPEDVIYKMYRSIQLPSYQKEGISKIYYVNEDGKLDHVVDLKGGNE